MGLPVVILAIVGAFSATVAAGSVQGLVPAIVGDRVGGAQQSRALSIVFIIGDLGSALGPPLGLWLVPLLGLGSVYRLCALLFFLVGMFAVWFALIESRVLSKALQLHSPPAR
jgi:MFS family permease